MKLNYYKFLVVTFLLTFTSCTKSSIEHMIDNPTDKEIIVNIDNKEISIPAHSSVNHTFTYGKHQLNYEGNSFNFMVKPSKLTGFINPTQSNYVIYKSIFLDKKSEQATEEFISWLDEQISSDTQVIIGDSLTTSIKVPFKTTNNVFIEQSKFNWDYFLNDSLPTTVYVEQPKITRRNRSLANDPNYQKYIFQSVKTKIFREADFLKFLETGNLSDKITFPNHKTKLNELPAFEMVKINLDSIACPEGRKAIESALNEWNKWLNSNGESFANQYNNKIKLVGFKIFENDLYMKCYDDYNKDFTYKEASSKVLDVINKLDNLNFFIVK